MDELRYTRRRGSRAQESRGISNPKTASAPQRRRRSRGRRARTSTADPDGRGGICGQPSQRARTGDRSCDGGLAVPLRGRSQNLWRLPKERTVPTFSRETLRLCLESIFWRGVDRQERRTLLAVLRRDSGESGFSSGAYPPEQRCPKSDERSSEDVVEMDSVSTRKGGDDYVPPVRTEPHDCRADDDRSHSTESVHRRAVLQETVTHAPLVLERSGERLVGEGSRLATARRTTFFARTARPKPGRSDKQGHAEPRRHPQGEHDREEDQRNLPLALRGLEPAQQVLRINLIVRAHCSPSPSIENKRGMRRATSADWTNGRRSLLAPPPRQASTRDDPSSKPGWPDWPLHQPLAHALLRVAGLYPGLQRGGGFRFRPAVVSHYRGRSDRDVHGAFQVGLDSGDDPVSVPSPDSVSHRRRVRSPVELGIPARISDEEWLARHARSLFRRSLARWRHLFQWGQLDQTLAHPPLVLAEQHPAKLRERVCLGSSSVRTIASRS